MQTTIKNEYLTVVADTHGAELHAIDSADGVSYLWRRDKTYWGYSAPTLFPIIGKLRDDRAVSEAGEIHLPKHGFARTADWTLNKQGEDYITYLLKSDQETRRMYPFDFSLEITYRLSGQSVTTEYSVHNAGGKDMPFTIGGHPAFRIPLAEGDTYEDYTIAFQYPETADLPQTDASAGLIVGEKRNRFLTNGKAFDLNHVLFRGDALLFDRLRSRSVQLYSRRSGRGVQMDFDGMDFFAVWSPDKDAPFVCLEPWTGTATWIEEDDIFEHKRGTTLLRAGETATFSFKVTVF